MLTVPNRSGLNKNCCLERRSVGCAAAVGRLMCFLEVSRLQLSREGSPVRLLHMTVSTVLTPTSFQLRIKAFEAERYQG